MTSSDSNSADIGARLQELKTRLPVPEQKEYQLDRLERLARKIGELGPACADCAGLNAEVRRLLDVLQGVPLPRAQNRAYLFSMGELVNHLKKGHHLVSEGENLAFGMVIGLVAGATLALIVHSVLATLGGLTVGSGVGAWLDARARRAGRVI
jgi:hypothetical protein